MNARRERPGGGNGAEGVNKAAPKTRAKKSASARDSGGVIVVGNLKGGSGKSTIVFNLAVWLAERGAKLSLVDLDPQRTLSDLVAVREEMGVKPRLAAPGRSLRDIEGQGWTLIDFGAAAAENLGDIVASADIVLVPVAPSQADIWATQRYLEIVGARRKAEAQIALFVNRAEPLVFSRETRETLEAIEALAESVDGAKVLRARLGRRVAFCRSLSEGLGVFELQTGTKAANEFETFAKSVMNLR